MKTHLPTIARRGLTLIELSLVILTLIALASIGMYFLSNMDEWTRGRDASEKLRTVYAAQRAYLADHPLDTVASLDDEKLIPYLPTGEAAIPTIEDASGATKTIVVNVSPPVIEGGYDPSGDTKDGLWDVGL